MTPDKNSSWPSTCLLPADKPPPSSPGRATRRLVLTACGLTLLLACGGVTEPPDQVNEPPGLVTVSGLLIDSLANLPMDNVKLFYGPDSTVTSPDGEFSFTIAAGAIPLRYTDFSRYETLESTLTVRNDTSVILRLRRTLPYLREYSIDSSGTLHATIIDLQGAQTIARSFDETWVVYQDPDIVQSSAILARDWTWSEVDSLTWRVSVATGSLRITAVIWNLRDERFPTQFRCVTGQPECIPSAP